jgi:hypothetical protein
MGAARDVQTRAVPAGSESIAKVITKVITCRCPETRFTGGEPRRGLARASGGAP